MADLAPEDAVHLVRALELARNGWGRVHPNPMVGCVIVRDGEVVGEGWHEEVGGPHAEVHALGQAGDRARGATAYVSLEPCAHFGRTGPCTVALMEAGIGRLVYGAGDPGEASGGGAEHLRRSGLEVVGPALTPQEGRRENPAFFFALGNPTDRQRPYVALKLAMSLDGGISAQPGERTAISGPEANAWVQNLRAGFDGILVGTTTARVDDPLLTARGEIQSIRPPARILLDRRAETPDSARIFREGEGDVVIFVGDNAREGQIERLEGHGASVHPVAEGQGGHLDLHQALRVCAETGISALLCEGGGSLAASLLAADLVDRMYLVIAPSVLGRRGVPGLPGLEAVDLRARFARSHEPHALGDDVLVAYERRSGDSAHTGTSD